MAALGQDIAGLVESLVRPLLDFEDEMEVSTNDSKENLVRVEIRVHEDDVGKVIGRQGRVIKAIRTLARAAAMRANAQVEVELIN